MGKNIETVIAAIDYIEAHLTEKLDLEIVAEGVYYSKYHLHRIFTDMAGLTIHDYVQRRKLTEAAKQLIFSDKPIIEIAFIAGYESQQAFTSIFKAMYKKTPNQYRDAEEFYPLQLKYVLNENPAKLDYKIDWRRDIVLAAASDISEWMDLVNLVVDGFPYLDEKGYIRQLEDFINKKQAFIMRDGNIAIGIMVFNIETGSIDFLGVHPQYRRLGIEKAFLWKVMKEFECNVDIWVTTFREGDKADTGYRNGFKKLGFAEAELLVEFGYPTQRMVLQKEKIVCGC